jgi:hypothetical protein
MSIPTTAPKHLWQAVRDFLCTFFTFVGHPADLAAKGFVNARSHAHLIAWLRAGEHFLRRLLFIEANALTVLPASCRQTAACKAAVRTTRAFDIANPETWRASFHCTVPVDRRRLAGMCRRRPAGTPAVHAYPTLPLARRYEALLRAFNNPLPLARRLARTLTRTPTRADQLRTRPHQPKRESGDPAPLIDMIGRAVWRDLENLLPAPPINSS